jgi:hypothetical protein
MIWPLKRRRSMTQILQWERVYFFKSGRIRIVKFKIAWSNQAVKFENSLLKIELCIKLFFHQIVILHLLKQERSIVGRFYMHF